MKRYEIIQSYDITKLKKQLNDLLNDDSKQISLVGGISVAGTKDFYYAQAIIIED